MDELLIDYAPQEHEGGVDVGEGEEGCHSIGKEVACLRTPQI